MSEPEAGGRLSNIWVDGYKPKMDFARLLSSQTQRVEVLANNKDALGYWVRRVGLAGGVRSPDLGPSVTPVVADNPVKVAACCFYTNKQHLCGGEVQLCVMDLI
ncbi:hypothetical protein EYF80_059700 [Liparis tanakae]|uniref:Uncharacterized protein n=1 Tax=Liparis tanakae TaxID=230148 RepID=A0A4Z2EN00_9TELE|nr:hypothetical protein EYF80_059700 [Liparis tanakae]